MKVLFLSANPQSTGRLNLAKEAREIQEALRMAKFWDKFEFVQWGAVRSRDLRRALLEENPDIVHFSGHGRGEAGLVIMDEADKEKPATGEALAELLSICPKDKKIQCVVLNACYAEVQAQAIVKEIDYVIGMKDTIKDDAAIAFSTGFYDGLGYDKNIEDAFKLGTNAIRWEEASFSDRTRNRKVIPVELPEESLPEHLKPILLIKEGINPINLPNNGDDTKIESNKLEKYRERIKEYVAEGKSNRRATFQLGTLARELQISQVEADHIWQEELGETIPMRDPVQVSIDPNSSSQPNRTFMGLKPEPSENQMIQDCKKRRGGNPITRKWEDVTEGSICNLNQDYEYRLIVKDISHASDLPSNECVFDVDLTKVLRRKVFILKVSDYYHVRIFDKVGELVVDKGKDEFFPDENLVQQFDEALNQTLDRQHERDIIQDITSSLSYSLDRELDLKSALEICFDNKEGSSNFTIRPSNEESRLRKDENIYLVFDIKLSERSKDLCLGFRCIDEFTTQYCYSRNQWTRPICLPIIRYRAQWEEDETYQWHSFALRLDNPDHWHPFPKDGFLHPPQDRYKVKYQEILGIVFELGTSTNQNDCWTPRGGSGLFWLRNIRLKSKDNLENIKVIETE